MVSGRDIKDDQNSKKLIFASARSRSDERQKFLLLQLEMTVARKLPVFCTAYLYPGHIQVK